MSSVNSEPRKAAQVSIAQYMYRNIQLLGFQNHSRVINVAIRELMDNSLDAANQSQMLPRVQIQIKNLKDKKYRISFKDYGPGMDAKQAPQICGRLLYGNKFIQSSAQRGCQGIGLTALILYSQKTTGTPAKIIVKDKNSPVPTELNLKINLKNNRPDVVSQRKLKKENLYYKEEDTGFMVVLDVIAAYQKRGPKATVELLKQYTYLNPNLTLKFSGPEDSLEVTRISSDLSVPGKSIKAVPHHLEIGDFINLCALHSQSTLIRFLADNFEGPESTYEEILRDLFLPVNLLVGHLNKGFYTDLLRQFKVRFESLRPHSEVLVDLGPCITTAVTKAGAINFDNVISVKSDPLYYQKGVLQVEMSAFYGGPTMSADQKIEVYRVANGMPLLYQSSACVITRTLIEYNWKKLGLTHIQNELPRGKMILFVHVNSTSVPFLTESKDAIAGIDVIRKTINECLDKLSKMLNSYMKREEAHLALLEKTKIIKNIVPDLLETLRNALKRDSPILSKNQIENLQSGIYQLLCIYKDSSERVLRIYNKTLRDYEFNFVSKGARYPCRVGPNSSVTRDYLDSFYLEDILPVEYVILDSHA